VASLVLGAGGLGHEAGGLRPPLGSPAPTSLACPHGEELGSVLVFGIGLRLWQSALSFPSLSFVYTSIVSLSLDGQTIELLRSTITITITIITIRPGLNAHTYTQYRLETGCRSHRANRVEDLLSPRSTCLPFLKNLRPQLSTQ